MKNIKLRSGAILVLLAILFTFAVRMVDVSAIGPEGTAVGFSHVNQAVSEAVGVHMVWYVVTGILGAQALLLAGVFALCGLIQLIQRRSLWKVDRELLALAGLYAVTFVVYVFFEVVIINYRPIIMPGETFPEASFPSSHTMLACVILGSAAVLSGRYIASHRTRTIVRVLCGVLCATVILGRFYSGVHWFTDICGGILYGAALLLLFAGVLERIPSRLRSSGGGMGRLSQDGKRVDRAKSAGNMKTTGTARHGGSAGNAKKTGKQQSNGKRKKKKR